jgi:quercetin dioxygenase-like cupin family protein
MDRYNWDSIPEEKMNDLMVRRVVHTPQATIARLILKKGAVVPLHSHVNEQVTTVMSGSLEFDLDGERFILGAGDVLVIPPHVPHAVVATEDCAATDYFTPARADWISGDDSYLRQK